MRSGYFELISPLQAAGSDRISTVSVSSISMLPFSVRTCSLSSSAGHMLSALVYETRHQHHPPSPPGQNVYRRLYTPYLRWVRDSGRVFERSKSGVYCMSYCSPFIVSMYATPLCTSAVVETAIYINNSN